MKVYFQSEIESQFIEEIISELSLKGKVSIAKLDERGVESVQRTFDIYVRSKYKVDFEDDEYNEIINRLWERLRETYRLRVVK